MVGCFELRPSSHPVDLSHCMAEFAVKHDAMGTIGDVFLTSAYHHHFRGLVGVRDFRVRDGALKNTKTSHELYH